MKTHTESSKSEPSSRGKQPFKVFVQNFKKKVSMSPLFKKVATRNGEGNIELALSTIAHIWIEKTNTKASARILRIL